MKKKKKSAPAKKKSATKKTKKKKAKQRAKAQQPAFPDFTDDEDPAVLLATALAANAANGEAFVAGLDEAGRGPLAGPVVAAACVLPVPLPDDLKPLNDSKKLKPEEREALYPLIVRHALAYGVAVVEVDRIDEINILRASLEAMAIAFDRCQLLLGRRVAGAVIDGNMKAPLPFDVTQRTVIGGDALSRPIMAASILAKVTRDRRMVEEHGRYPGYGFDQHKGYSTPQHQEALEKLGPCALHRKSFAPIMALLPPGTPLPPAALAALARAGVATGAGGAASPADEDAVMGDMFGKENFGPIDPLAAAADAEGALDSAE